MAYTPELTQKYSGTLRRVAWAFEIPMTKAIEGLLDFITNYIDGKKICEACRDDSFCEQCPFNQNGHNAQLS